MSRLGCLPDSTSPKCLGHTKGRLRPLREQVLYEVAVFFELPNTSMHYMFCTLINI